MNLLAVGGFVDFLKGVFVDWAIALLMFFAVLTILAALFKGPKLAVTIFLIALLIAAGFVVAALVTMLATWDTLRLIDLGVKWIPTILFAFIVVVSVLVNCRRGLRKSLILLLHSVIVGAVCLVVFFVCSRLEAVDKAILYLFNTISGTSLQSMLGVSADCSTIREIFVEYLPGVLGGDFKILLAANPQYILTLADMAFRLVFAVITLVLYYLLEFIMYLVYFFSYPERRHKKEMKKKVVENAAPTYRKNRIGGALVGLARGVVAGLLALSFIGSAFFMVAGGTGTGMLDDYDLNNDDYNAYYSIYRSIESYGSTGIFKILNMMTDVNDMPFYLFAADMVFSGELNDEENDIKGKNIKFREELAAYTGFARNTFSLLMKYGEEDIVAILNGEGTESAFDTVISVMSRPGFREEFDLLIEEFEAQTYIINFGMSLVTSIADHIDEVSFTSSLGEDNKELIKLLFKKGYLSEKIPDERQLLSDLSLGKVQPSDKTVQPYIKVSHLLTKQDVRLAVKVALSFLSGEQQTSDVLAMVKSLLPEVRQLSILKTSKAGEMDPVLTRLYAYMSNRYLTAEGEDGVTYASLQGKSIHWLDEINTLLDVADDGLTLWDNISGEGKTAIDIARSIFDKESETYEENVVCYDNIRAALEGSAILDTVMSTNYLYTTLKNALSAVSENIYVPKEINYARKAGADGAVIQGEVYQVFGGFKLLSDPENSALLDQVLSLAQGGSVDTLDILDALSAALTKKDRDGNTLSDYFTQSQLLRSVLSIVMIEQGQGMLYVPKAALESENGAPVNMVTVKDMKALFDNLADLMEFVKPLMGEEGAKIEDLARFLNDDTFTKLLDESRIFEGTVAYQLMSYIKDNEFVSVPYHLAENVEDWLTTVSAYGYRKNGELKKLLRSLELAEIDIAKIADGEFDTGELFDTVTSFDEAKAEEFLSSEILHYTVSKYLLEGPEAGGVEIVVPYSARAFAQEGDALRYVVKKVELIKLFTAIADLGLSEDLEISAVLQKLVLNKATLDDCPILAASVVCTLMNNGDITGSISIPESYLEAGRKAALEDYNSYNPWKAELPRFINALDEILGITQKGEDFTFDEEALEDSLSELLQGLNKQSNVRPELTKLRLCYLSEIVRHEMTVRLDDTLSSVVSDKVLSEAKAHGYYTRGELEALSEALEIFHINIIDDSDLLVEKVKEEILTLNEPLGEDGDTTKLDAIYPSHIISSLFCTEIDKALEGLIEQSVVNYIKGGSSTYDRSDIAALIDAINELGITLDGLDFDIASIENLTGPSEIYPEKTRLGVIYDSRIAAGVITKSIYDSLNSGDLADDIGDVVVDHSKAYVDGVRIYRAQEVESMCDIFPDLKSIDLDAIDLDKISLYLYDETADSENKTKSYLLAAVASALFKNNENLIIPVESLDEEGCVWPQESALIITVFHKLNGDKSFDEMEDWEIDEIPNGEVRTLMFASMIMRACITDNLIEENSGNTIYISEFCVKTVLDTRNMLRRVITEEEFNALTEALDIVYGNDDSHDLYDIPTFTLEALVNNYTEEELTKLLASNIIFYRICESLLDEAVFRTYLTQNGISPQTQLARNLATWEESQREVISADTILAFCAERRPTIE